MQPNNSMYLLVVLQTCCIGGLSPLDFHFHMEYSLQEKVKITMEVKFVVLMLWNMLHNGLS